MTDIDALDKAKNLVSRYQQCVYRILDLFGDDLPAEDPAHFLIERLESILDRGLLVPKKALEELKVERDRSEANAFMASQREMRKIGENNELRERMNNLLAQQKEIIP